MPLKLLLCVDSGSCLYGGEQATKTIMTNSKPRFNEYLDFFIPNYEVGALYQGHVAGANLCTQSLS